MFKPERPVCFLPCLPPAVLPPPAKFGIGVIWDEIRSSIQTNQLYVTCEFRPIKNVISKSHWMSKSVSCIPLKAINWHFLLTMILLLFSLYEKTVMRSKASNSSYRAGKSRGVNHEGIGNELVKLMRWCWRKVLIREASVRGEGKPLLPVGGGKLWVLSLAIEALLSFISKMTFSPNLKKNFHFTN